MDTLSFIVPAYNEETELPGTLGAIRLAAESAGHPYEIIVVDDASTDRTAAIGEEFGARVISVNRRQIAAVRNAGAQAAKGGVLLFVDADTRIAVGHITGALAALEAGSSGGSAKVVLDRKVSRRAQFLLDAFSTVYFGLKLGVGAFIFTRREKFEAAGGFDEQYFAGEEVYLTIALKKLGPFKILQEPIVTSARKIRMHPAKFVLSQSFFICFGGKRSLRTRARLDLWYDGKREHHSA